MTKKRIGIVVGVVLLVATIAILSNKLKGPVSEGNGTSSFQKVPEMTSRVYEVENGWGYEILVDGERFIFQETIPGIPMKKRFQSQSDADKCARLVLKKIGQNQMPSISREELDSLQIDY